MKRSKFGDGAIASGLSRFFDIIIIGILTFVCSIPIITMGAAITAAYDVYIKMVLQKESHVVGTYFSAFGKNFLKSTGIHLLFLIATAFVGASLYVFYFNVVEIGTGMRTAGLIISIVLGLVVAMTFLYVYALQARFENPILRTILNAFFISIAQFPKTFAMLFFNGVFLVLSVLFYGLAPLWIIIIFSVVYYFSAVGMVKAFGLYGDKEAAGEEVPADDDFVMKDITPEEAIDEGKESAEKESGEELSQADSETKNKEE